MGLKLCLVSCFPNCRGRLSEYAEALVKELAKLEEIEKIDILSNTETTSPPKIDKVKVIPLWENNNALSILKIIWYIIKNKPHIVHYNISLSVFGRSRIVNFIGLALPALTKVLGFKTITTMHNFPEAIKPETAGLKKTLLNVLGLFIATKLACSSHTVVVLVRSYLKFVKARYNEKAIFIPHGAWFTDCKPDFNINHGILFLGHIGPNKDIELLVEAFKKIKENPKFKEAKLFIVGAPHPIFTEYINILTKLDGVNDIYYIGYLENGKLPKLLKNIGLIVLPYKACTGTSGVVHLLAAFGKPMIASDLPEFRELAREGAGIMIIPHRVESFVKAITNVMLHPSLAEKLGRANRKFAEKRKWALIARQYLEIYRRLWLEAS